MYSQRERERGRKLQAERQKGRASARDREYAANGRASTEHGEERMMTITSGKQVVAANDDDVYDVYKQGINFLTRSSSRRAAN